MARKFDVHILLYSEDDISIAHCLEFDIVAQGKKKIEALKNLLDAIELQISFALKNNDLTSIFNPAPAEYWKYSTDRQNERIQVISVYSVLGSKMLQFKKRLFKRFSSSILWRKKEAISAFSATPLQSLQKPTHDFVLARLKKVNFLLQHIAD